MFTKTNLYEKNGHVFYNVTSCKGEQNVTNFNGQYLNKLYFFLICSSILYGGT